MTSVYIAAPYPLADIAIGVLTELEAQGVRVTSRWITNIQRARETNNPNEVVQGDVGAREDLADVAAADILLALNPAGWENTGTGGRHVELGFALALQKQIILVGERTNVFHYLSHIKVIHIDDVIDIGDIMNAVQEVTNN